MSSNEFLGMLVIALTTLGGLIAAVWKILAPINNNLTRFNMNIERLFEDNHKQDKYMNENRELIFQMKDVTSDLNLRVTVLENK